MKRNRVCSFILAAFYLGAAAAQAAERPPAGSAPAAVPLPQLKLDSALYRSFNRLSRPGGQQKPPPAPPPRHSAIMPDFSFGGDDNEDGAPRPDGGLDKENSAASVGLKGNLSRHWQIGGGTVFDGKARGARADFGYKW